MTIRFFYFSILPLLTLSLNAQVGIGTETPNASSILELSSTSKGLLVPRMTEAQKNAISSPAVGLLVYQTNGQGFYYKDNWWWKVLASNDNKSFLIGQINIGTTSFGSQNTRLGDATFAYASSGSNNTAIGHFAISSSNGSSNTAVGENAMRQGQAANVDGSYNTAVGARALTNGDNGGYNTAIGASSIESTEGDNNSGLGYRTLISNTTGNDNTAIGYNAGDTITTGSNNTLVGSSADVSSNNLSNATAIGANATVTTSNTIQLGDTNVTNIETSGTITAGAVTYPNTDGTNGQVLKTDGSGTLAWITPPSPSVLYQKIHYDYTLTSTVAEIITLNLPAGSYLVTYTAMAYKSSNNDQYVASRIATTNPGNLGGGDAIKVDSRYNDGRAYIVHQLAITLANLGNVSVYANTIGSNGNLILTGARLTALSVGSVINQ